MTKKDESGHRGVVFTLTAEYSSYFRQVKIFITRTEKVKDGSILQEVIFEIPFASVSNRGLVQNLY